MQPLVVDRVFNRRRTTDDRTADRRIYAICYRCGDHTDDFLGDGPGARRLYLRPAVLSPSAVRPLEMSVRDIAWSGILAAHIIGKKAAYQSLTRRATGSTTT